ncbi:uncharacterized protein [Clytia hemisphaerica]|uniref:Uncharacterized protein n=1 Tax=Clytia hemisphaerica TaxID=252671 RepID=A0A7M5UNN9_9CNID
MDTSNNEELDAFVDKLLQIELLTGIGRELIRKKVINILRERRKYVKQKFNEMEEIGESENQLENAPSFLYLEREGEMTFHQEASGHHQEASGHHHKVEMHSESDHEYDGDNSNNSDGPLKKRFKNFPSDNKT